jgi:hypothetical protein
MLASTMLRGYADIPRISGLPAVGPRSSALQRSITFNNSNDKDDLHRAGIRHPNPIQRFFPVKLLDLIRPLERKDSRIFESHDIKQKTDTCRELPARISSLSWKI